MRPEEIRALHATPLAGKLPQLSTIQQIQIAECAYDHGIVETANILDIDAGELTTCMVACGYAQCPSCDDWKEAGELEAPEGVSDEDAGIPICNDCRG